MITVIVPVYRGVDDVARCLESVLRHAGTSALDTELLIIDDASPEPEVSAHLDELASKPSVVPVTLLRNAENLGFVATVNRGLRHVASGDVVILNADTVVVEGWLDRLSAAASEPDVATVTPLTNFGSICTLPRAVIAAFDLNGPNPRIDECGAFVAEHGVARRPEVITAVGFCMYVTRPALDLCGLLDEETFGLGYGEEVDFCLRATRIGLRHLVEDSTFVWHHGAVSFGEQRQEGLARGSSLLHGRYQFFRAANMQERAHNPLHVSFKALELGLWERRRDRPHVLHILHSPPGVYGGTEKHLRSLMFGLIDDFDFSVFYPVESGFVLRTLWNIGTEKLVESEFLLPGGPKRVTQVHDEVAATALRTALDLFDFDAVHIQNLIGHSLAPLEVLADFPGPVVCSVRDLYLACPHHWLLYLNEQPCGLPDDLSLCARCLPETRGWSLAYLEQFRATVADRLDAVDWWVFATQSAADYLLRVYDLDPGRVELIEHGAIIGLERRGREVDESLIFDEPLRLAFVGEGWPKKGLPVVNRLADHFAKSSVELHHFGVLKASASPQLHLHGPYDNELLPELLHRAGIQIVLLPGAYAETFGHVMTEAFIAGLPVIGATYGALGERIRHRGAGWTIDPTCADAIEELIENLDRCRAEVLRATRHAVDVPIRSVANTADRYAALYRARKGEGLGLTEGMTESKGVA